MGLFFFTMFLSLLKPQILIHFYSQKLYDLDDPSPFDMLIGKEKESKSSKQPAASQQYIYQYKIQYIIIPNTFSNKESIAHKDSLHNQLKNFISYPLIVWGGGGGGGGLLITSGHYYEPPKNWVFKISLLTKQPGVLACSFQSTVVAIRRLF